MGFSQVIEENGVKKLVPITTPASATAQEAKLLALEARETAQAALPKAGGKMTGEITRIISQINMDSNPSVNQYIYPLKWRDVNEKMIGGIQAVQLTSGRITNDLQTARRLDDTSPTIYAAVSAIIESDGTAYAAASHPRPDNYGNDIVTTKAMKDYALKKTPANEKIHIGGTNKSDTADLNNGRGSEAMPFASIKAALAWASATYASGAIQFILHEDQDLSGQYLNWANTGLDCAIVSDSTTAIHKITCNEFKTYAGRITLSHVELEASENTGDLLGADGALSYIRIGDAVKFSGTVSGGTVSATNGATIVFAAGLPTGNVTGPRYRLASGGSIFTGNRGEDVIPGSQAGVKQAGCVYA